MDEAKQMWDERFREEGYAYGREPNDFLREQAGGIADGGRVLCLADGEGRNSVWLAKQGFEVTAVDISEVGLAKAQRLAEEEGVEIKTVCADLKEYDMGKEMWDAIVWVFVPLPTDLRKKVYEKVGVGMKGGGRFVMEMYTPRQLEMPGRGGGSDAGTMVDETELRREIKGFDFEVLEEVEREIVEGSLHAGVSAVVRMAGRKV
ncbi:class I SAM-dependent methyltransferase [Poriferisphaera sp. WC338]|uniref:class I SAM-dependent methyltransferase n=1 Tax=Poriferisphaera sp. WC338 TaxID=3425129 RepID=UPI003D81A7CA